MALRRVFNSEIDGTAVTISMGKIEVPMATMKYGDAIETATYAPMGSQQQGRRSRGRYKTDPWEGTMSALDCRTILWPLMPKNGGGNKEFPIVVNRKHPDLGDDSDLLEGCRILKMPADLKNTPDVEMVTIGGELTQIKWTDERKTLNDLDGVDGGELQF